MNNKKRKMLPTTFITKEVFSLIGFLFALLFTVRGICQVVFILASRSTITAVTQGMADPEAYLTIVLKTLKSQHIAVLDMLLMILCGLILFHGIFGVYYTIKTGLNIRIMFREKVCFYLQIISAVAAVLIVMTFTKPAGEIKAHSVIVWILTVLAALLGSFHIANGFYNAGITLGISVSGRSRRAARIVECIVAVFSMLQIFILFI